MKKILCAIMCICIVFFSKISVHAGQTEGQTEEQTKENVESILTINGCEYNAQQFMQRVIECTKRKAPLASAADQFGNSVEFRYDDDGHRIKKITTGGEFRFEYDADGSLVKEILPDGETIHFSYTIKDGLTAICGLVYQGTGYTYCTDEDGIITGLCDLSGQEVCVYQYDGYGCPVHIYETGADGVKEHYDNTGDSFVGCLNPVRYRGECYDAETKMYCLKEGGYYSTQQNKVVGADCYVDKQELFGDKYQALDAAFRTGYKENGMRTPSVDVYNLTYAAVQYYEGGLGYYTGGYDQNDTSWYTNFSSGNQYYLVARIIYAENKNLSNDSIMELYLNYNRQGVGWEIINRYLEDDYRYKNGKTLYFSNRSQTTVPSFYSVLTKSSAFTSLTGSTAKGPMDSSDKAYQEAFWIASCIRVCSNFQEWDAVVPRPTGVTSQCYNRGGLTDKSKPDTGWKNVVFPGYTTDYTGEADYSTFKYSKNISLFNVLFSYKTEKLFIDSVYYQR